MKVIVDTNVVLDVLLARQPHVEAASRIFALVERSGISACLCATTVTTMDYLLRQALSPSAARHALVQLLEIFDVAAVNRVVIEEALRSTMPDFEDAVLDQAGRLAGAEAVVTRNPKDFRQARLKVLEPLELLAEIGS
ncbi:MAG: PIN domain-containing protein [Kiritimatiellae bacterium]|nr:PIN domain-containing protein [Kiritimatiellia bacterium]